MFAAIGLYLSHAPTVTWVSGKIFANILNFIREHHIITSLQSGFIPGDSTVNRPVDVYNTFNKTLDEGKEVQAIFYDISKVFDRGIKVSFCWFADCLANKTPARRPTWSYF